MAAGANSSYWTDVETWDKAVSQYEDAVIRSTKRGAERLLTLANEVEPLSKPLAKAIDLGAGTGSLTPLLAAAYPSVPIVATDISPGMVEQLKFLNTEGSQIIPQVADMASPIGGAVTEDSFSHVFSTMAIQNLPEPAKKGTLDQWARLLTQDGVVAIGMWDFDESCGPHQIWAEAAAAVDPKYINPPMVPAGHWTGLKQLEEGLEEAGFSVEKSEVFELGFDVGKEGFMRFFWDSGNPMTVDRKSSFKGDVEKVRIEMDKLLDEAYDGGKKIPLFAALAVARKLRPK